MAQDDLLEHEIADDFDAGQSAQEDKRQARNENMGKLISNPNTRPKVIFTIVSLLLVAGIGLFTIAKVTGDQETQDEVNIANPNIPKNQSVTLDDTSSQAYKELKEKDNDIKSEAAQAAGGAHIEIPVGGVKNEAQEVAVPTPAYVTPINPTVTTVRDVTYDKGMQAQYGAILGSFNQETPKARLVQVPQQPLNTSPALAQTSQAPVNPADNYDFVVKAGRVELGTIDLEANSDEPGEILATIRSGTLKGAKAICNFTKGKEALTLRCPLVSPPWGTDSYQANILLIDADNNKKDLATDVDHHYLERFGFLLASSFVQGLGEAAMRTNSVISTSPLGSTQTQGELDPGDTLLVAAGRAGSAASAELNKRGNIPVTVKVAAGQPVGFLFLSNFKAKGPVDNK